MRGYRLMTCWQIFAEHIDEWPKHLVQMKRFWRSVIYNSGEFSGSPMVKHVAIGGLQHSHFAHWLALFYQNLHDISSTIEGALLVAERAHLIANSLLMGVTLNDGGLDAGLKPADLPQYHDVIKGA